MDFLKDFIVKKITHDGVGIHIRTAGSGHPILLLHGYPQTGYMWHKIAPKLATKFTVVIADLRGYGDSDKPKTDQSHETYSKRAMAADMNKMMQALGHRHFAVAGHDRGGRVAHRLGLDYPNTVTRLAVLDIIPTESMYKRSDKIFATAYYHWFFLIQPAPFPETLIGQNPEFFLKHKLAHWGRTQDAITKQAFSEYLRCFSNPKTIHASCEDYRAAASIDLEHDAADERHRLTMPTLALWGQKSFVGQNYNTLQEWSKYATQLRGQGIPGGHFLAEESPEETLEALSNFFQEN